MKKYSILLFTLLLTANISFGAFDFVPFNHNNSTPQMSYPINNNDENLINAMNQNSWSNPYANENHYRNPITRFFHTRNSNDSRHHRYPVSTFQNTDIEYLLSKMERNKFSQTYSDMDIDTRLNNLESEVFGASQSGDFNTRLNRLRHAFSSEANTISSSTIKNKLDSIKKFFSSGSPTSMPAPTDYYTTLEDELPTW